MADYAQRQLVKKTSVFAHTWGLDQTALLRVAREHTVGTDEWHHEQKLTQSANLAAALQAQTATGPKIPAILPSEGMSERFNKALASVTRLRLSKSE